MSIVYPEGQRTGVNLDLNILMAKITGSWFSCSSKGQTGKALLKNSSSSTQVRAMLILVGHSAGKVHHKDISKYIYGPPS